jgi:hypothetical protein
MTKPNFAERFRQIMAMPGEIGSTTDYFEGAGAQWTPVSEDDHLKFAAYLQLQADLDRHYRYTK